MRNESEGWVYSHLRWDRAFFKLKKKKDLAPSTGLASLTKDLSVSISVGTRKMVNLACVGRSQGKPWWRLEAILTCKSIVKHGLRGERLIEPSSSWFPPKFPSG